MFSTKFVEKIASQKSSEMLLQIWGGISFLDKMNSVFGKEHTCISLNTNGSQILSHSQHALSCAITSINSIYCCRRLLLVPVEVDFPFFSQIVNFSSNDFELNAWLQRHQIIILPLATRCCHELLNLTNRLVKAFPSIFNLKFGVEVVWI